MNTALTRTALLPLLFPLLCGCADLHYKRTEAGKLEGRLIVEWYQPNLFVYRPDSTQPLKFQRKGATQPIEPGRMYTDGGSIPRSFWVLRNYSPWGYGPAFVVHDWLFHMQNCQLPGYQDYSLHDAAVVMSEVMKTLMQTKGFDYGSKSSVYLMYEAVQTPPAAAAWEHGRCENPDAELALPAHPDATFVIEAH